MNKYSNGDVNFINKDLHSSLGVRSSASIENSCKRNTSDTISRMSTKTRHEFGEARVQRVVLG